MRACHGGRPRRRRRRPQRRARARRARLRRHRATRRATCPAARRASCPCPGSGTGGRADLPAEHGFRFFPGFYRHLPDTMRRIPHGERTASRTTSSAPRASCSRRPAARNELIAAAHAARVARRPRGASSRFLLESGDAARDPAARARAVRRAAADAAHELRRAPLEQWEQQSWWEYIGAERRSAAFQKFLADGLTRTLVAARAREMSARTGGLILLQLLFDLTRAGGRADRVLDAPTSEAWIDPWVAHLERRGVDAARGRAGGRGSTCADGRITGVTVDRRGGRARDRRPLRRGAAGRAAAAARSRPRCARAEPRSRGSTAWSRAG